MQQKIVQMSSLFERFTLHIFVNITITFSQKTKHYGQIPASCPKQSIIIGLSCHNKDEEKSTQKFRPFQLRTFLKKRHTSMHSKSKARDHHPDIQTDRYPFTRRGKASILVYYIS